MDLDVSGLSCRRSGRLVFRDLSFALAAGGMAELRGPNGVGKSTLLRVLAGLIPAEAGAARLGGIGLGPDRDGFQERLAYVGHLDAVKPQLGVAENLRLWAGLLGAPRARVGEALARFGLDAVAERRAGRCSAGQKRRLGLARLTLAPRPLWLLDEPMVSLDADAAALLARLIAEHLAAGGMALVATHVALGVEGAGVIRMEPLAPGPVEADPFLAGEWR